MSKFLKQENNILLGITESLYVLGYPRGINIALTPIWKRSSIASAPDINPNGIPYFYIDTTTREGMSGSPVIFYTSNGSYQTTTGCSVLAGGFAYNLVGIYSGRNINDESHIAQLGKVWKKESSNKLFINILMQTLLYILFKIIIVHYFIIIIFFFHNEKSTTSVSSENVDFLSWRHKR